MIIHKLCIVIKFLVHLSQRLKCTIVIMRRPSVSRPSVVVNFSHFRLLLWNCWTEFNETWQEARSQRPLQSLWFLARSEKQDGRPGLWLAETFSTSPLKPLNRIQRHLTGSKISMSSTKFVFFGSIGKTRWSHWLDLLNYHAQFHGNIAILAELTFEIANFGNFTDIPNLKLSLPSQHMGSRMWHCSAVRLAKLLFLYFL